MKLTTFESSRGNSHPELEEKVVNEEVGLREMEEGEDGTWNLEVSPGFFLHRASLGLVEKEQVTPLCKTGEQICSSRQEIETQTGSG